MIILQRRKCFHPGKVSQLNNSNTSKIITKSKRKPSIVPGSKVELNREVGCLIPLEKCPQTILFTMAFESRKLTKRKEYFESMLEQIHLLKKSKKYKIDLEHIEYALKQKAFWFRKDQRLQQLFRRFVQLWLYNKYKGRKLNTEDPITLCEPEKAITLFDVRSRGTYVYEAKPLLKYMESELSYTNWLFPEPKHPKNSLNNLQFTEGQRIQIHQMLKSYRYTSWILEAYIKCQWNLVHFRDIYFTALKLEGLKSLIRNPSSEELQTLLYEFIEDHYNYHDIQFGSYLPILQWAIKTQPEDPYMKKWLAVYHKFTFLEITYGKQFADANPRLSDPLYDETERLLTNTAAISRLGKKRLESLSKPPIYELPQQEPSLIRAITHTGLQIQAELLTGLINIMDDLESFMNIVGDTE
jgi:hypothetical protein